MPKVAAPRSNIKATKIAFKVLGLPKNLELIKKTPKEREIETRLWAQNTYIVR